MELIEKAKKEALQEPTSEKVLQENDEVKDKLAMLIKIRYDRKLGFAVIDTTKHF